MKRVSNMLYIGYLVVVNGLNIKKLVLKISIFELPRAENCISTLCPSPLGSPPHPPKIQIGDFMWFSPYFGVWTGAKGLGHNLLMQFSNLYSSKMEISENFLIF